MCDCINVPCVRACVTKKACQSVISGIIGTGSGGGTCNESLVAFFSSIKCVVVRTFCICPFWSRSRPDACRLTRRLYRGCMCATTDRRLLWDLVSFPLLSFPAYKFSSDFQSRLTHPNQWFSCITESLTPITSRCTARASPESSSVPVKPQSLNSYNLPLVTPFSVSCFESIAWPELKLSMAASMIEAQQVPSFWLLMQANALRIQYAWICCGHAGYAYVIWGTFPYFGNFLPI